MVLNIQTGQTIADVQQAFHAAYPHLKLLFFSKPHDAYKGSPAKYLITDREQLLGGIELRPRDGVLHLEPEMPTWQVERLFEEEFGLHVQVFRQSGNVWLETSVSDSLTLEQQEVKGAQSVERHEVPIADPIDWREQD
jgi:hypothetical protein